MYHKRFIKVAVAWIGVLALVLLFAAAVRVNPVASQDSDENDLNPVTGTAPAAVPGQAPAGSSYDLFAGNDTATLPQVRIDVASGSFITAFVGIDAWGAAYDPANDKVYHNDGSTLYEWPVDGVPALLGDIIAPGGGNLTIHGLAFYDGVLYGTSITTDEIYVIDTATLSATTYIALVDTGASISGLAADPTTGELYGTDDLSNVALVKINLDGTLTSIAPYLGGETDVDGLAISPDRKAYLITDDNTPPEFNVYDLNSSSWSGTVPYPWGTAGAVQVSGAWIVPNAPEIEVSPAELDVEVSQNAATVAQLTISNTGTADLDWLLVEEAAAPVAVPPLAAPPAGNAGPAEQPVVRSVEDCALFENYAGAEPEGYAQYCVAHEPQPWVSDSFDPSDTAYAQDIGFVSDNFVSHALNDFPGQTAIGPNAQPIFAMDFDPTGTTLYAIDNTSRELGTYNLATGAFAPIAVVSGIPVADNISGLTIDPASGVAYVSGLGTGMTLYTIDLGTAVATPIGTDPNLSLLVDIAIGPQGVLYGHDIETDAIFTIDTTTGLGTVVGPTGVNSNFAQGMDFDNADGTLYAYTYQGGGANQYGTIDLTTGALTPLAIDNPTGEFEGATQTIMASCDMPADIPWLSTDPISGTVAPESATIVDVTFDASGLALGVYTGTLCIESNAVTNPVLRVPVTMTVSTSNLYLPVIIHQPATSAAATPSVPTFTGLVPWLAPSPLAMVAAGPIRAGDQGPG